MREEVGPSEEKVLVVEKPDIMAPPVYGAGSDLLAPPLYPSDPSLIPPPIYGEAGLPPPPMYGAE